MPMQRMTENTKHKIGILALFIMFLILIAYTGIVIAEYYVSRYGEQVEAKVTRVDRVCRHRNKYVTLQVGTESVEVQLYGLACREADFILGSIIKVRRSKQLNIVTVPENYLLFRLIFFPIMTGLAGWGFIHTKREWKRG